MENESPENLPVAEVAMEFDLTLNFVPVKLKEPKTGIVIECELRELTGLGRDSYLNLLGNKARIDPNTGKTTGIKNHDGLQSGMLAMALWRKDKERYFNEAELKGFPNRVLDKLVDKCADMSKLKADKKDDKSKNDSEESEGSGSD